MGYYIQASIWYRACRLGRFHNPNIQASQPNSDVNTCLMDYFVFVTLCCSVVQRATLEYKGAASNRIVPLRNLVAVESHVTT